MQQILSDFVEDLLFATKTIVRLKLEPWLSRLISRLETRDKVPRLLMIVWLSYLESLELSDGLDVPVGEGKALDHAGLEEGQDGESLELHVSPALSGAWDVVF